MINTYENLEINIVGAKPNYGADNIFYISLVIIKRRGHYELRESFMTTSPYISLDNI
jgi:hypothetical protein